MSADSLQKLASLIRNYILTASTQAGSGHPTSSLSAADLMTVLWFGNAPRSLGEGGFFHYDFGNPDNPGNDRLVFSKGHATPLYYSLFLAAGQITPDEIMTLRKFDSVLEGHPTPRFKFTEAATGSLGQGLSVGVGLALAQRTLNPPLTTHNTSTSLSASPQPKTYVLLGDGEMAEGSMWEAINIAGYYKLGNLVAILDVNRLGQSQPTMLEWDTQTYEKRFKAFGWETIVIDGHDLGEIADAFKKIFLSPPTTHNPQPKAIIAKTIKGKGVSFLENKEGWHGKPLKPDELEKALKELGKVDLKIRGTVAKPASSGERLASSFKPTTHHPPPTTYHPGDQVATRKAYGTALARLGAVYPQLVVLDAEVKNSTYAEDFAKVFPDRYFEMFIAEQNMVGVAVGLARLGYIPFASSFACFLTRGFDQIRMAAVSEANLKFCGSHAGVSIGEDGPSQMGLEDLAMFRAVHGATVLYPSDAVSTEKLVEKMLTAKGICYLRTTRPTTPVIYGNDEEFPIGGCKIHLPKNPPPTTQHTQHKVFIIAAGITLFESLKAQEELAQEGISVTVVDCYSIKPIDAKTLNKLISPTTQHSPPTTTVITVEDHWSEGGLGDAVLNVFSSPPYPPYPFYPPCIHKLAVSKMPRSGKPAELLQFEGIDAASIVATIKHLVK